MSKKLLVVLIFHVLLLTQIHFFELKTNEIKIQKNTIIGLTINGSTTTNFPSKDSGLIVDSILCDKESSGEWDYENWGLKIKNITQSRTKCQINFINSYKEEILNGTDPVLKEGLIPVTIDNNGTVKKADITKEWYRYEKQQWANAVILENEKEEYLEGQVIPENNIESYFVWIPRYKYKIWNMGKYETLTTVDYNQVHIIDVIFGTDTTKDTEYECATPNQSGADGTCSVGKYMTHPAFTSFDTEDKIVNGLWVGKFETGYKEANSTSEAEQNPNGGAPDKVMIKPNVYSWRGINMANAHLSSYNYKREYDSHMMKNTEWGAVAYLSHSKYGSHTSVRVNNNSAYITGYAAVNEPSCTGVNGSCNQYGTNDLSITRPWNTDIGYKASTTGNISGIYDMSGGGGDYVMSVVFGKNGVTPCVSTETYHSGFRGIDCATSSNITGISFPTDEQYFDKYISNSGHTEYHQRILGDATGEMGPFANSSLQIGSWYEDDGWFVFPYYSWFYRGYYYASGTIAGVFAFNSGYGAGGSIASFRVVLSF